MEILTEITVAVFALCSGLGLAQCGRISSEQNTPDTIFWGSFAIVFALLAILLKL